LVSDFNCVLTGAYRANKEEASQFKTKWIKTLADILGKKYGDSKKE
jgi:hypothetical protein